MPFGRIARPLLAAAFVANGVDALLHSKAKADAARPLLDKAREVNPAVPAVNPVLAVQAEGAIKVGAALMMAFGRAPRLAATVLAVDLIPSTVAEHPFWSRNYPDDRKAHQVHFLKNLGLLGGLLLAITDTGGKPSLAWRAKQAKKEAKKSARQAKEDALRSAGQAREEARRSVDQLSRRARRQAEKARKQTEKVLS